MLRPTSDQAEKRVEEKRVRRSRQRGRLKVSLLWSSLAPPLLNRALFLPLVSLIPSGPNVRLCFSFIPFAHQIQLQTTGGGGGYALLKGCVGEAVGVPHLCRSLCLSLSVCRDLSVCRVPSSLPLRVGTRRTSRATMRAIHCAGVVSPPADQSDPQRPTQVAREEGKCNNRR